jgi:hypothetical protein
MKRKKHTKQKPVKQNERKCHDDKNKTTVTSALEEENTLDKTQKNPPKNGNTKFVLLKRLITYFRDIVLAFVISIVFSGLILLLIYKLLPYSSWISLSTVPSNYIVNNFSGGILSEFKMLNVNYGKLENETEIILNINGQTYDLKPYELRIEFNRDKDIIKYNLPYANISTFIPKAELYSLSGDENKIVNARLEILKHSKLLSKSLGRFLEEEGQYDIKIEQVNVCRLFMSVFKGTEISVSGGVDIYVKENKISPMHLNMVVEPKEASSSNAIFELTSNNFEIKRSKDDYVYLEGLITSFTGKSDNDGTLKHTYLRTQNEYEISSLTTSGKSSNQQLSFDCELSSSKQILNISGLVHDILMANSSLYFNFKEFIANNMGEVVLAVFTTFIITYIPLLFSKK